MRDACPATTRVRFWIFSWQSLSGVYARRHGPCEEMVHRLPPSLSHAVACAAIRHPDMQLDSTNPVGEPDSLVGALGGPQQECGLFRSHEGRHPQPRMGIRELDLGKDADPGRLRHTDVRCRLSVIYHSPQALLVHCEPHHPSILAVVDFIPVHVAQPRGYSCACGHSADAHPNSNQSIKSGFQQAAHHQFSDMAYRLCACAHRSLLRPSHRICPSAYPVTNPCIPLERKESESTQRETHLFPINPSVNAAQCRCIPDIPDHDPRTDSN